MKHLFCIVFLITCHYYCHGQENKSFDCKNTRFGILLDHDLQFIPNEQSIITLWKETMEKQSLQIELMVVYGIPSEIKWTVIIVKQKEKQAIGGFVVTFPTNQYQWLGEYDLKKQEGNLTTMVVNIVNTKRDPYSITIAYNNDNIPLYVQCQNLVFK